MVDDCSIGEVAALTGVSQDTLRYYEKIGLFKPVARDAGGRRRYRDSDLERLRFIRRGQKMNFSLDEIAHLLELRDAPGRARRQVRAMAAEKLQAIEQHLAELSQLRGELQLLLNLCTQDEGPCPILQSLDGHMPDARNRTRI